MEWTSCGACGGEGWHDATEDDPMMYAPGDTKPCPECDGKGGAWFCETITCKTIEGTLEIKAPNDQAHPRMPQ
jgi:DnaJ-class molecular chaperone